MSRLWMLVALVVATPGQADAAEYVLQDPLNGSSTGNVNGGQFVDGGWKAPHQIWWELPEALSQGGMSVELDNWNPNEDSPQHKHDKQHIINMYEAAHGSPHSADGDSPMTDFFNIRTGSSYDNHFKFLSSTGGFTERIETRIKCPTPCIDPSQTHEIKVEWTAEGDVTVFRGTAPLMTHSHGKSLALRYVFIGTDNAPAGTYGPQHDVVYKNLKVWGEEGPGPGPEPVVEADQEIVPQPECVELTFEPVADTWVEPSDPGKNHGADDELRVGGDGRTIFFKFDIAGAQEVTAATLKLKAMNGGGGGDLHTVNNTGWDEYGVTFDDSPGWNNDVLSSLGKVNIGANYTFDLGTAVEGDGSYAFAITSDVEDGAGYHSKESSDKHPVLVLTSCGWEEPVPELGVSEPWSPDVVSGQDAWEVISVDDYLPVSDHQGMPEAGPVEVSAGRDDVSFGLADDDLMIPVEKSSGCASGREPGSRSPAGLLLLALLLSCGVASGRLRQPGGRTYWKK